MSAYHLLATKSRTSRDFGFGANSCHHSVVVHLPMRECGIPTKV